MRSEVRVTYLCSVKVTSLSTYYFWVCLWVRKVRNCSAFLPVTLYSVRSYPPSLRGLLFFPPIYDFNSKITNYHN